MILQVAVLEKQQLYIAAYSSYDKLSVPGFFEFYSISTHIYGRLCLWPIQFLTGH